VELEDPQHITQPVRTAATKTLIETFKKAINALTVRDKATPKSEIRSSCAKPVLLWPRTRLPCPEEKRVQPNHWPTANLSFGLPHSGGLQRCDLLRKELHGRAFQIGLCERRWRYFQLLPGFHGQAVREADCHCRNEGAGRFGCAVEDGKAAAMVRRHQTGADRREVRLRLCGRREFGKFNPTSIRQLLEGFTEYKAYPPGKQEKATQTVLEQAEVLSEGGRGLMPDDINKSKCRLPC